MRTSRILRDIREKSFASCAKLNLNDPRVVELAGLAGFSAVWICREHVPGDWLDVEHMVRAAKVHDTDVIVRIAKGSYSDYIKPFECDASAIMVPHVTSADEARAIVEQCRFRPLGNRPLDGGNVDGAFCQTPLDQYLEMSNREKLIILQIESPEAVEAVDEIAAVEGYDFLLFGPGDYSHRIGKPGDIHSPEVLEARAKVEAACLKHGKAGFGVAAQGTISELRERGYRIANFSSDVVPLGKIFRSAIENFNNDLQTTTNYYSR